MNLADAIRRAGAISGVFRKPQALHLPSRPVDWTGQTEAPKILPMNGRRRQRPGKETGQALDQAPAPQSPSLEISAGNAIRLEMSLSGEQMTSVLKAITAGQHSVLTLKEAAAYLRTSSKALERLIEDGGIPALEIDGKYTFPKTNLDDWIAMKTATTQEKKDVA